MYPHDTAAAQRARDFLWSYPIRLVLLVWSLTAAAAVLLLQDALRVPSLMLAAMPGERFPSVAGVSQTYLWSMVACAPPGVALFVAAPAIANRLGRKRNNQARLRVALWWAGLITATGLPVLPLVKIVVANPPGFTIALPGAIFAVWFIHRIQRNRRIPLWTSLLAFGWGATIAITAGHAILALLHLSITSLVLPSAELATAQPPLMVLSAPVWEEFAKGVGVLVLFHQCRRRFDGIVAGVVIGAMVGAGFNFMETTRYAMTSFDLAIYQVWIRQWVSGFVLGHVLFTALFGASVGLASKLDRTGAKAGCLVAGFGLAALAHFAWNYPTLNNALPWSSRNPTTETIIMMPLNYLTLSGAFCVVLGVVVWLQLRREARAIRATLPVEAATDLGAITPVEADVLANPARRLAQRVLAVRTLGPLSYVRVGRLHAAQLDLVLERWRLAHEPHRVPPESERELRARIWSLRRRLAATARAV